MTKLSNFFALGCVLVTCFANPCLASPRNFLKSPLRVGLIGGLTGPVAPYGSAAKNGLLLAIEQSNAQELIEVRVEDDGFVPSRTVSSYLKLTSKDHIEIVMATGSTPALALAPLTRKDNLPFIACASDPSVSAGSPNVLRNWIAGHEEGQAMAELTKIGKWERIAALTAIDDYSKAVMSGYSKSVAANALVLDENVPQDLKDFRALIGRAKSLGASGFALCLSAGQPGVFALQASQLGLHLPIVSCLTAESRTEWDLAKGALKGAKYITIPVQGWFREAYEKKFGSDSVIAVAAAYFDIGTLLAEFVKSGAPAESLFSFFDSQPPRQGALGEYSVVNDGEGRHLAFTLAVREVP